jgi:hypothetical protein
MRHRTKVKPGWKMTEDQFFRYWREVGRVCDALGAKTKEHRDDTRKQIHLRAFDDERSAKEINKGKDFDNFLMAVDAILDPSNLAKQMRRANMECTRLIEGCRQRAPEDYIVAEAVRKFGQGDWTQLNEDQLTMLRNHLSNRAADMQWPTAEPSVANSELVAAGSNDPDWTV